MDSALAAIENGADKIRINPGNIGNPERVKTVVDAAKERNIPIRVGVNSGSLEKPLVEKYGGVTAEGIVESALDKVHMIEDLGYDNLVISIKSSDVLMCVKAHELLAGRTVYPLHVGITESGTVNSGNIKSAIGLSLIIAGFGVQIIKGLGGGYTGYHRFALIIAATFIFTIAVTVINLPKKQVGKKAEKVSFKDIFSIIKRNDQLRWAVALILLYNVGIQLIMGVATYYFAYVCNNSSMLSAFMISASIAEVVGLIIFPKVTKMLSRKKAFLMACILPAIGLLILLLTGIFAPQNIVLTVIAGVIVKTGTGLELGCATVFLADVVDYGEYRLGIRNEGVVFSLQTLIVKLTAAFTSLSIGFALDLTGYVPNQIQSLATQNSIRVLMCVIPAVGMLLAYVVYRRKYKLNDAYMKKVVSAISSPKTELTSEKTTEEES